MGGSRPGHLEGLKGGKNHEEKVTTPSRELWGHAPGILNFGSLKQHFLVNFPPTQHIEALI